MAARGGLVLGALVLLGSTGLGAARALAQEPGPEGGGATPAPDAPPGGAATPAPGPAGKPGDAGKDDPDAAAKEVLRRQREWDKVASRVSEVRQELGRAQEWIHRAILLVELADLQDRRALPVLTEALVGAQEPLLVAFVLHGLARQTPEDLRRGGGAALFDALLEHLDARLPYLRRQARDSLAAMAGEDLGARAAAWKRWRAAHAAELTPRELAGPLARAGLDPELVSRLEREAAQGQGTTLPPLRCPKEMSSLLRELNEQGLDVVLILDQTGSMGAVIEEAKVRLESLIGVIEAVVKDFRIGLVTYHDQAARVVGLQRNTGRLRETLSGVRADGGGDFPEGVDKGLIAAFQPDFGWRRRSTKAAVILGDAPPHPEDMKATLDLVGQLRTNLSVRVHAVSTGGAEVAELAQIAAAGGGKSLLLGEPAQLVSEVLLLILGEEMRPGMERFVPVLLEILEAAKR